MLGRWVIAATVLCGLGSPAAAAQKKDDVPKLKRGELAIQARSILLNRCGECHGLDHASAPAHTGFSVLKWNDLIKTDAGRGGLAFIDLAGKSPSHLLALIDSGTMPPGGRDRPTDAERKVLAEWIAAGVPSYPQAFDEATTLNVMLDDFAKVPANDRPFIRYVSYAHMIEDSKLVPNIATEQERLLKALIDTTVQANSYIPDFVDDSATLLRVDIRKLGWHERELFEEDYPTPMTAFALTPYDFLLLEYPHGFTLPAGAINADRLAAYLDSTKPIRPVPFVRGDWLATVLTTDQPLANEMKWLMELAQAENKKPGKSRLGPYQEPFAKSKSLKIANPTPQRRPIVPIGAAHALDVAIDTPPFEFTASIAQRLGMPITTVKIGEPYKLEVSCDREVQFYVFTVLTDGTIRFRDIDGGNTLKPGAPALLRPSGLGSFTNDSINGKNDTALEHFVVIASEQPIPKDAIKLVKSRHQDYSFESKKGPIWRLVFQPKPGTLDEAKVVRKVLPLTTTRK